MDRTLSHWSCWRKAARSVRLPRLIPPSEPTWASSDEAAIADLSPSWHCVLLLFLFLYQTLSFPSVMRACGLDDDNPPRSFRGILQGFPFFPGQNAASGSQHSRSSVLALVPPIRRFLCVGDVNPCLEMKRTASLWLREAVWKQFGYNWHGIWEYI